MGYYPQHRQKDTFFAKATVDDLVALEQVKKHKLNEAYTHTDEEDLNSLNVLLPPNSPHLKSGDNPLYCFKKIAAGPRIAKPSHIFLIVGESYLQQLFDPAYACLHVADGGKRWLNHDHTASLKTHSLPVLFHDRLLSVSCRAFLTRASN